MNDAFYILKGKRVVECDDVHKWAKAMGKTKSVRKTRLPNGVLISTLFLGRDCSFLDEGAPMLFETMVIGGKFDQKYERYPTYDDAVKGHRLIVKLVKKAEGYIL